LRISYELTKPAKVPETYIITTQKEKYTISSENEAFTKCAELEKQGVKFEFEYIRSNISMNKMYFPKKETLLKFGVTGIIDYPYPQNKEAMNQLAKAFDEQFELVGDFD